MLNELLTGAWEEYTAALKSGTVLELEAKYKSLVSEIVKDVVHQRELPSVDLGKS